MLFLKGTVVHGREEAYILFLMDVEMLSGERLRHSASATLEVCLQGGMEEAALRLESLKAHLCLVEGQGTH